MAIICRTIKNHNNIINSFVRIQIRSIVTRLDFCTADGVSLRRHVLRRNIGAYIHCLYINDMNICIYTEKYTQNISPISAKHAPFAVFMRARALRFTRFGIWV